MNDLVSNLAPAKRRGNVSIYQKLFISALSKMKLGQLKMTFPDGTLWVFGDSTRGTDAEIQVHDAAFFKRSIWFGDIGFAESYLDGLWDTPSIKDVILWAIQNVEDRPGGRPHSKNPILNLLPWVNRMFHAARSNTLKMSRKNIAEHYDLGNSFYELWLDPTMTYSSAYFTSDHQSLTDAQTAKYERLCRQLQLSPKDHVLEIGCGWGGFSSHAAKKYGCKLTSITISEAQYQYAKKRIRKEGLVHLVEVRLEDYRNLRGRFDKIVSIEMMEALGDHYLKPFFSKIHELLQPDGMVGLQYITVPDSRHDKLRRGVDFIQKHIFPGSLLLSVGRVNQAINATGDLFLHDLKDMGSSYARTLREWEERFNFEKERVCELNFDERFIRKWNYYLQYCEAAFASRNISVVQAIYVRPNNLKLV